jgi:tetratricopeptide (TPR) repeat protein
MPMRLLLVLATTVTLLLQPATARAQAEAFVQAVRELADATAKTEPVRSDAVRAAVNRMRTALSAWDRNIDALEGVAHEIRDAPEQRAYELHVQLGVAYRARGRGADALREFDAAARLKPSSDLQVLRALTLEAAGRTDEAGRAFRAAWNLDVRNPIKAYHVAVRPDGASRADRDRARAMLADTYRQLGAVAGPSVPQGPLPAGPAAPPFVTLGIIADNLSRTPVVADQANADGFALLAAEKYSAAVAALEQPERAKGKGTGDSPASHFVRGQRHEAENQIADARREYQAALAGALAGRNVLLVAIARLAQVEGDLNGAVDALTRAARLNPNDPNIRKELAGAHAAQGNIDDAFCELMAVLLIDPRDAQAHAAIGQLYLDAGRDEEAVSAFNRALALMPDRYEARYGLATAFTRLGRTAEAAREFDLFERVRREKLAERRRDIARDVEQEERQQQR